MDEDKAARRYTQDAPMDELLKILRAGYDLHPRWGSTAADTIERLQRDRDDAFKELRSSAKEQEKFRLQEGDAFLHRIAHLVKELSKADAKIEKLKAAYGRAIAMVPMS